MLFLSGAYAGEDVLAAGYNQLSSAAKRSVQEKLTAGGFYSGTIDGAYGRGTKSALIKCAVFIKDNSYGKVVFDLTTADGAVHFLDGLARGELDKYLWGDADESENG